LFTPKHIGKTFVVGLLLLACASVAAAQQREGISDTALAELTSRAMSEFKVPGMAVGIVKADKILLAKGYGAREIGKKGEIDPATLFKIASNSKAFTTAALAILVDEGLVSWDGPVIDYIPEFRMSDPWVTANFNVTDLLTHRSGLRSHVGDQLLWPIPNAFTRTDVIHALQYFELVSGFRTQYAYDNLLYIVAGEIVPRVSGTGWGEFVESRIMRPAGMNRCFADSIPANEMQNLAAPHGEIEGALSVIERGRITPQRPVNVAAGGIVCSLGDMLTWARMQLSQGTISGGPELFSTAQSQEMWKPHTRLGISENRSLLNGTHFYFYGLGWRLADVHGYQEVSHTGGVAGFRSMGVMVPELELGVVVLTNGSRSDARNAVMNTVVRSFMPVEPVDWIQLRLDEIKADQQKEKTAVVAEDLAQEVPQACCAPDLSLLTGRYRSPWFGDVSIYLEDDRLMFASDKSPKFIGNVQHQNGNRFIVRWTDRTMNGDAWVMFEPGENGFATGMSMLSVDAHGDYDYKDLVFSRIE